MKRTLQFVGYFDQGHVWIIATLWIEQPGGRCRLRYEALRIIASSI